MNSKEAKSLFTKYTNGTCTDREIELLETFLDSYQEKNKKQPITNLYNVEQSKVKVWKSILNKIDRSNKQPLFNYYLYAAAAVVILLLGFTVFYQKQNIPNTETQIVNTVIKTGTDKATLTLEDGSTVALEKGKQFKSNNLESNGKDLIYNSSNKETAEIGYNHLTIPRGGQYHIKLSDGTDVWLNSESQLKYPVHFVDGKPRIVELVYGEAYFDVSPSTEHAGATFSVRSKHQIIDVLGTEFNVKAYQDEQHTFTTLVEGKVAVTAGGSNYTLKPGQQSIWAASATSMKIQTVDVYSETSWKKGLFSFKNLALKDIMKVLSRWYDVDVEFKDSKAENTKFNGVLNKDQDLEKILATIQNTGFIKSFKIESKKIMIE